jgi:hypothetical protein
MSLQHLLWYEDEGEDMLNKAVTGDELWVHHYQPEPEYASMQLKHPSSPFTKKFNVYCVLGFSGSTVSPFSEVW